MRLIGATNIDFIGKCRIAVACSLLVIGIGMVAMAVRGETIFDIDFTGGVSVTMVLQDSLPPDEVRGRLDDHFENATPPVTCTVNTVGVEGRPDDSVYKIDANLGVGRRAGAGDRGGLSRQRRQESAAVVLHELFRRKTARNPIARSHVSP